MRLFDAEMVSRVTEAVAEADAAKAETVKVINQVNSQLAAAYEALRVRCTEINIKDEELARLNLLVKTSSDLVTEYRRKNSKLTSDIKRSQAIMLRINNALIAVNSRNYKNFYEDINAAELEKLDKSKLIHIIAELRMIVESAHNINTPTIGQCISSTYPISYMPTGNGNVLIDTELIRVAVKNPAKKPVKKPAKKPAKKPVKKAIIASPEELEELRACGVDSAALSSLSVGMMGTIPEDDLF